LTNKNKLVQGLFPELITHSQSCSGLCDYYKFFLKTLCGNNEAILYCAINILYAWTLWHCDTPILFDECMD